MSEPRYVDIRVENGGWLLDDGTQPRTTSDRHSIGQDIQHTIMESGLARKLVGERSGAQRADVMTEIELLVEEDVRLVPGTIALVEMRAGVLGLTAQTYDFGPIEVTV